MYEYIGTRLPDVFTQSTCHDRTTEHAVYAVIDAGRPL